MTVHFLVQLGAVLFARLAGVRDVARGRIADELTELLNDLDVSRPVEVTLSDGAPDMLLRIVTDGRECDYVPQLFWDALAYTRGSVGTLSERGQGLDAALDGLAEDEASEVVATVARQVVARHANILYPDVLPSAEPTIDVLVEPSLVAKLLAEEEAVELFPLLRDGMFSELGITLPTTHLHLDYSLRPNGFAFRINGVRSVARIAPTLATFFVAGSAESLRREGYEATPSAYPSTSLEGAVVSGADCDDLEAHGYVVWNTAEYLVLALAGHLRADAASVMSIAVADAYMKGLGETYPVLGAAAARDLTSQRVIEVLRGLLRDRVAVNNFRRIIELMLRYRAFGHDAGMTDEVEFVRAGLADAIAAKLAHDTDTVVVYLLGPELEAAIERYDAGSNGANDAVRTAVVTTVRAGLADTPAQVSYPALLTRDDLRRPLADLLRRSMPAVDVVARRDLPPSINVQPVGYIELAGQMLASSLY
ncbi:MAG: FHIPEP family type III secretion protein [Jatrophihabitantaceae bacterium]